MRVVPRRVSALMALCTGGVLFFTAGAALAQPLRIVSWNISNYAGGRIADVQTVIYGEYQGRSMRPDVILGQEFISESAVGQFLWALNNAPGAPGDWAAAPFINGPDTDSALFYRTTRVQLLAPGVTLVAGGGASPNHPRNLQRYDIRPIGYAAPETTIGMYNIHMKAGNTADDRARRNLEAQRIVTNAASLPTGWGFLVGGDFNVYTSNEEAYRTLVGPNPANATGPFFDPIRTPGSWNNAAFFRFVHTQDPVGAGGMDDRFDQILLSDALLNGSGLHYIGNPAIAYSTFTWDDPNHSYRAWGNDGSRFDQSICPFDNQMVGQAIAQAICNAAAGAGHIPVFLDMRVPARTETVALVDFGRVPRNAGGGAVSAPLTVTNGADVALWTEAGVATLVYTLAATAGFTAPEGPHMEPPSPGGNTHTILMDTTVAGLRTGVLTIFSDDPENPARTVLLTGEVTGCTADWNGDGVVNSSDISAYITAWLSSVQAGDLAADFNGDGSVSSTDISAFITAWLAQLSGC